MELVVHNIQFSYKEAVEFCTDNRYYNPQHIPCFEAKYFELVSTQPRLPKNPREAYKDDAEFFAFSSMFGEELYTYIEAKEYCIEQYTRVPDDKKPTSLNVYYKELRESNKKLTSSPVGFYKDKGCVSIRDMFGLPELEGSYSYSEAKAFCSKRYESLLDDEKPTSLKGFYRELRASNYKLPSTPSIAYKDKGWMTIRDMFGLPELEGSYSYSEAKAFCSKRYESLPDDEKPANLQIYYQELRACNSRIPASPIVFYKDKGFVSIRDMFGFEDLYNYCDAKTYCTEQYETLSDDKKPTSLNRFYRELRVSNDKLPSCPSGSYKGKGWVSYRCMFGFEDLYNYSDAMSYCSMKYDSLPDEKKPSTFYAYYQKLRASNDRLPACPNGSYKGKGWVSYRCMFGLEDLFNYGDAKKYCTEHYENLPDNEKPTSLAVYYKALREINERFPSDPSKSYKSKGWVSYRSMFGLPELEALYSYNEAKTYSCIQYKSLPDDEKPVNLAVYFKKLKEINKRLPRNPEMYYKGKGWHSYRDIFGVF